MEDDAKETDVSPINPQVLAHARASALPVEHLRLIVETFEALADLTRARILYALTEHPMCVRE